MTDYWGYVVQGLFVGLGGGLAAYFTERYTKPYLQKVQEHKRVQDVKESLVKAHQRLGENLDRNESEKKNGGGWL
jgi:hypothetical protein